MPAEPFRKHGLTWITHFFIHGSILHLVGNLYFLSVFGDNVEARFGRARYAILLAAATFGSTLLSLVDLNGAAVTHGGFCFITAFCR